MMWRRRSGPWADQPPTWSESGSCLVTFGSSRTKSSVYWVPSMCQKLGWVHQAHFCQSSQTRYLLSTFFTGANEVNLHADVYEELTHKSFLGSSEHTAASHGPVLPPGKSFFNCSHAFLCCTMRASGELFLGKLMTLFAQGVKSLTQTLMPLCSPIYL